MRVGVTGATGFLGRHLVSAVTAAGATPASLPRELMDERSWAAALEGGFDRIIHLAFPRVLARGPGATVMQDFVRASSRALAGAMLGSRGHLVLCSSAAVYAASDTPISETDALAPLSPYGLAKLEQERLLAEAAAIAGWDFTIARVFNVLGPGQPPGLMATDLLAILRAAPPGDGDIPCGPLATWRDYVDAREVADRLGRLPPGCFNLCRGEAVSGAEIATFLCERLGVDVRRLRPRTGGGGVPFSCGDPASLTAVGMGLEVGWRVSLQALVDASEG